MNDNATVVFAEPRRVIIENKAKPEPGPRELLIKTKHTLISSGTELTILNGEFPAGSTWADYGRFPFIPGYDNVGEVIGAGQETDQSLVGATVSSYGSHAQYVAVPIDDCQKIHRDIPDEEAVFSTIAEIVLNGVRRGKPVLGSAITIFGLGLLGQLAVRFCRLCGAQVCAVDIAQSRLDLLPKDPGIIPINPAQEDIVAAVKRATRGHMADIVFEVTGNPKLIPDEFKVLHAGGTFVMLSSPHGSTQFDFHDLCNGPSHTIIGAHNSSHPQVESPLNPWTKPRHRELFFDLIAESRINVKQLISHREKAAEAPALYEMLLKDRSRAMGVVLEWE